MDQSRDARVDLQSTNGLLTAAVTITQRAGAYDAVPDPAVDAVSAFMNLKNNTTSSRYRATLMSPTLQALWDNLKALFPTLVPALTLQDLRVEAPRSSYKYSFIIHALEGATNRYYYWNSTNGFIAPTGGNALFNVLANISGNSYSGMVAAQYNTFAADASYTAFRGFFTAATGMTIIQSGNAFYFRAIANPLLWIKFEPTSW
jgi:hypothetical protein